MLFLAPTSKSFADEQESAEPVLASYSSLEEFDLSAADLPAQGERKLMVYFWSLYCHGCVKNLKEIQSIQTQMKDPSVDVVTVHLFEPQETRINEFAESLGLELPIFLGSKGIRELFSVRLLPTSLIFDRNRQLVQRFDGELSQDEIKLTLTD